MAELALGSSPILAPTLPIRRLHPALGPQQRREEGGLPQRQTGLPKRGGSNLQERLLWVCAALPGQSPALQHRHTILLQRPDLQVGIHALQEKGWLQPAREKRGKLAVDLVLERAKLPLDRRGGLELLQAGHFGVLDSVEGQSLFGILQEDADGLEEGLLDGALEATEPGHIVLAVPLQAAGSVVPAQPPVVVRFPRVEVLGDDPDAHPAVDQLHLPVVVAPVHEVQTQHLLAVDEAGGALRVGDGAQHPFGPLGAEELDELVGCVTVQVDDEGNCVG